MAGVVADQKSDWYLQLDRSRTKAADALKHATQDLLIEPDFGWTLKDVLAHLTTWEVEIATSIHNFAQGKSYSIMNWRGRKAYDQQMFMQYRDTPYAVIFSDWIAVRYGVKSAIRHVPPTRLDKLMVAPWEERVTLDALVTYIVDHETQHIAAIQQAAAAGQ